MVRDSRWATIEPFITSSDQPVWVTGEDKTRLAAYDVYDAIYWTNPGAFKLTMRGQEGTPIYIPAARKIVETAHRYLATGFEVIVDPEFGSDAEKSDAQGLFLDFARRERLLSKFSAFKRTSLKKGDALWHLYGDETRSPGARLSIQSIDPGIYFPEYDASGNRIAVVLAATTNDNEGKPAVRRLSYRKETGTGGPSTILISDALYPPDEWGQPGTDMNLGRRIATELQDEPLPAPIDQLPIYHVPNIFDEEDIWGSSEFRGVERLFSAINQGITDEELTLILEGLGVYTTDAGQPVDEESGEPIPWELGPARVVEIPKGHTFNRVSGAGTVAPYQDHLGYLHTQVDDATGTNDVTRGNVDVAVAESGIALLIRMSPLLARMTEKELIHTDIHTNLLFDLRNWFAAYESLSVDNIRWIPRYGDKLPVNKKQLFEQVMSMYNAKPPLISGAEARRMLLKVGYTFSDETELQAEILQEQSDFATLMADAEAIRLGVESGETP